MGTVLVASFFHGPFDDHDQSVSVEQPTYSFSKAREYLLNVRIVELSPNHKVMEV
ncbi:hypothetical protein ACERII_24540 [Evansella sp. AB-rgal1]|uniref:hypothetical protein n=1 Tax=Evansella sp. AB-rgal1 TaxID=3242696 RepID=UPI00359EB3F2